ncbi:MAG: hypothetical protein R6U04_00185 [Bacteroidales bacterium]
MKNRCKGDDSGTEIIPLLQSSGVVEVSSFYHNAASTMLGWGNISKDFKIVQSILLIEQHGIE